MVERSQSSSKGATDLFVLASCCKGSTVEHDEMLHALACLGLYPTMQEVERALKSTQLRLPLDLRDFQQLSASLLTNGCARGRPVVPYSRRGVSTKHISKLRDAFIANGWLDLRCMDYNAMHGDLIGSGSKPKMEEDFYSLIEFVIIPLTDGTAASRSGIPGDQLDAAGIQLPPAKEPCSFSELVSPSGRDVDYFVSHHWGQSVATTTRAIEQFSAEKCPRQGAMGGGADISYWMSCFSLAQHEGSLDQGEVGGMQGFQLALSKVMGGMLIVIDHNLYPFRRLWCLYELYAMHLLGGQFQFITESGSYGKDRGKTPPHMSLVACLTQACALSTLARSEEDRTLILAEVMNDAAKRRYTSFAHFKQQVRNPPPEYCLAVAPMTFSAFDTQVRELLAGPLLREALLRGAGDEAIQFLGFSQDVGISDLQRLSAHKGDLHARVPTILFGEAGKAPLTYTMALKGHDEELNFLLEYGLDVHARGELENPNVPHWRRHGHSTTALHAACWGGHRTCAQALLDSGACVNAKSALEATPLWHVAATPHQKSSVAIASLLLARRADLAVVDWTARTVLHAACETSNVALVGFLLEQRASANARDNEDETPLHTSSSMGSKEVVSVLLSHRADASVCRAGAVTPLQIAQRCGHHEVVKLFLGTGSQ